MSLNQKRVVLLVDTLIEHNSHKMLANRELDEYLENEYKTYISDIHYAIGCTNEECNDEMNKKIMQYVGNEKRTDDFFGLFIENIEKTLNVLRRNSKQILNALRERRKGKIISATRIAFDVFNMMADDLDDLGHDVMRERQYYRFRQGIVSSRKEMFHIPIKKKQLIGEGRYNPAGYPCLYLSSQMEMGFLESNKPNAYSVSIFKFADHFHVLDISDKTVVRICTDIQKIAQANYDMKKSVDDVLRVIRMHILKVACMMECEYQENSIKYHEEYFIPQMLTQWILEKDRFEGIEYEPKKRNSDINDGNNIVLFTHDYDEEGYDRKLRNGIILSSPKKIILSYRKKYRVYKRFIHKGIDRYCKKIQKMCVKRKDERIGMENIYRELPAIQCRAEDFAKI